MLVGLGSKAIDCLEEHIHARWHMPTTATGLNRITCPYPGPRDHDTRSLHILLWNLLAGYTTPVVQESLIILSRLIEFH